MQWTCHFLFSGHLRARLGESITESLYIIIARVQRCILNPNRSSVRSARRHCCCRHRAFHGAAVDEGIPLRFSLFPLFQSNLIERIRTANLDWNQCDSSGGAIADKIIVAFASAVIKSLTFPNRIFHKLTK